jgi:hypothetical protein
MNDKRLKPVWGAEKISEILGVSLRKAFYLLEKGLLPARKVGGFWQSTEGELEDFLSAARLPLSTVRSREP